MKKPKAYVNVLKLRLNLRLRREVIRNYPIAAFIEPTLFCQLRCPACPTGLRLGLRPKIAIDEALFQAAIDQLGDYLFRLSMYNWGEPLLHKRTPEMIRYAKDKTIEVVLSTNLSLPLTDDFLDRLVASGLDAIIVSLDGTSEETYSQYRRGGDFALVRENMQRIQNAKRRIGSTTPKVIWQFLVFRHNEHEIAEARAVHRAWGADEMWITPAIMPVDEHSGGLLPSSMPSYNMYDESHPVQREASRLRRSGKPCSWLYGAVVVNPGGTVSPCCGVPSAQQDFGVLQATGSFLDVWNNEMFRRARRLFAGSGTRPTRDSSRPWIGRLAGMAASSAHTPPGELICGTCPIPHHQGYAVSIIDGILLDMARAFVRSRSLGGLARDVLRFVLMGAPLPSGRALRTATRMAIQRVRNAL